MEPNFSFNGLDHVQISAPPGSEPILRKIFVDILGMTEIEKPENLKSRGGAWFKCGSNQIHVGIENDFRPAKKAHPAISVKNLTNLRERLISNGITVKEDQPLPGANRFYVDDPFGNRIEFLEWL